MNDVPRIIGNALKERIVEVAVVCLDGCGTSIISDPSVMERVGDRIIGTDSASIDQDIIDAVGADNVLDPDTAQVDNVEGVCVAYDNGIHKAAVTTGSLKEAQMMRDMFGSDLVIIGVFDKLTPEEAADADYLLDICIDGSETRYVTDAGKRLGLD